jgi:hypothetical protein
MCALDIDEAQIDQDFAKQYEETFTRQGDSNPGRDMAPVQVAGDP